MRIDEQFVQNLQDLSLTVNDVAQATGVPVVEIQAFIDKRFDNITYLNYAIILDYVDRRVEEVGKARTDDEGQLEPVDDQLNVLEGPEREKSMSSEDETPAAPPPSVETSPQDAPPAPPPTPTRDGSSENPLRVTDSRTHVLLYDRKLAIKRAMKRNEDTLKSIDAEEAATKMTYRTNMEKLNSQHETNLERIIRKRTTILSENSRLAEEAREIGEKIDNLV